MFFNSFDLLFILSIVIAFGSQIFISLSYKKYKEVEIGKNIIGSEAAREVLNKNDLSSIYVVETSGNLTDHYDPNNKVIRLSKDIYNGNNVASLAVSMHEVGHAIQYKEGNKFIKVRSMIYPLVNFSSKFSYIAILLGLFLGILDLFYIGIGLFCIILLFQLITLPVEFDASNKAIKILRDDGYLSNDELAGAKRVLTAAALTYVASVATSLLQILRLVSIANRRR